MDKAKTWYEELKEQGVPISEEQRKRIEERINSALSYEPVVGIFGKTGAGKSSLCNALFGSQTCKISDVAACTREPQEVILSMGQKGIKLLDVPGVGETQERDKEYAKLYASLLPQLDLVLWVIKADDRALASEQAIFKEVVYPHVEQGKPFFFVVNQVDKIEPSREWDDKRHEPGPGQYKSIKEKAAIIQETFAVPESKVIAVSAVEKYNLACLVNEIVFALPKEKNIVLFKAVKEEHRTETAEKHVKKSFGELVVEVIKDVTGKFVDVTHTIAKTVHSVIDAIKDFRSWWPFW